MKRGFLIAMLASVMILGSIGNDLQAQMAAAYAWTPAAETTVVSKVLRIAETSDVKRMPSVEIEKFALPPAGVDVMRIRMEGTYTINGIGTDRVELSGWLACIHRDPKPAPGMTENSWNSSIIDTEFVGFDISGESKLFGTIRAYLDPEKPSSGKAGAIQMPSISQIKSAASSDFGGRLRSSALDGLMSTCPTPPDCPGCEVSLNLIIEMPQLGLRMKTAEALRNYSFIESIPPVGATPSFALAPTSLVLDGREVGTLKNSSSKLREVVMRVPFDGGGHGSPGSFRAAGE
ncbi:MAG TPA: DUF6073 family protein [Blastocatellia bacterium]|nr:DUF6073 family protein [Blastocatellia bacterium]